MNGYDYGRKIMQMPGFKVEAWIDPTQISTRIKKSAQKMIRTGVMTGGYRSTARMLAKQLMDDARIVVSASYSKWGVVIFNATLTHDTKAEIINLLEAARMIEIAGKPESNHSYVTSRYQRAMSMDIGHDRSVMMSCYVLSIARQIAEIAAASRTPFMTAEANKLADQLDDVALIKANIHTPV